MSALTKNERFTFDSLIAHAIMMEKDQVTVNRIIDQSDPDYKDTDPQTSWIEIDVNMSSCHDVIQTITFTIPDDGSACQVFGITDSMIRTHIRYRDRQVCIS